MVGFRTLRLQVSSDSKFTIDSPPLANSALLGGRKRATTGGEGLVVKVLERVDLDG